MTAMQIVFEGQLPDLLARHAQPNDETFTHTEDSGAAAMCELLQPNEDARLFVRLMSFDDTRAHAEFKRLLGRRVRMTLEVLDD